MTINHERIAKLNDLFRTTFLGGRVLVTPGITAMGDDTEKVISAVRAFNKFEPGNDPYGEHDFGAVEIDGEKVFWKIDYYAKNNDCMGSENPADPAVTARVLTIMKAEEY